MSFVTLDYGQSISVDTNVLTISHRSDVPVSPLSVGTGVDFRFHGIRSLPVGGRVSLMWQPPSNFDLKFDVGSGYGVGFHTYTVDYMRPVYNDICSGIVKLAT